MANGKTISTPMSVVREALDKLSKDKDLTAEVERLLDQKEAVELGSLGTAVRFMDDLGETLANMPELGSTPDDVKGTNRPSDKYEATITVDGEHKTVTRSYWDELFESHPVGAAINKRRKAIQEAKEGDEVAGVVIKASVEKAALLATEAKRMSNWKGMGRRAVDICQQVGKLQRFSKVSVRIFSTPKKPTDGKPVFRFPANEDVPERLWRAGEYLVNTPRPIMLCDVVETQLKGGKIGVSYENETAMSVSQFLGLNPDGRIVKDKDGNVDNEKSVAPLADDASKSDLVNSNKRGPKKTSAQPGQTAPRINNDREFFLTAMEQAAYIGDDEHGDTRVNRLFATKDDAQFVMLYEFAEQLASRLKGDVLKRYNNILDKQHAQQANTESKVA